MDSERWRPPSRREEIATRLAAVRSRLKQLRERDVGGDRDRAAAGERLDAAQRHAAEAHAAAAQVLASGVEAFRKAAEAHERVVGVHETAAAAGIGDVLAHKRQAALHRAGAAADWQRAERAQSLLSESAQPGPAAASDESGNVVAPLRHRPHPKPTDLESRDVVVIDDRQDDRWPTRPPTAGL